MIGDRQLVKDVIDWIPETKIGVFGYCQRCQKELWHEHNLFLPVNFWRLVIRPRYEGGPCPSRYLCEICGNWLIQLNHPSNIKL